MNIPAMGDARAKNDPAVRGFMTRVLSLIERTRLAQAFGISFEGKRDYYTVFGWDRTITSEHMWSMYHRGGISKRIVHAYPDAVWGRPPQLYIKDNPTWNAAWDEFASAHDLWATIHKADILARLGRYSVILVGTNRGNLVAPLGKANRITYMQPYSEKNVKVSQWETDPASPDFGLPKIYTIYPNRNRNTFDQEDAATMPVAASFRVHASRLIHLAHGTLENSVFGVPTYAPIWNYLIDLIKVVGSSSESYWMTAYQGLHANLDKEMDLNPEDESALSDEIDEYQHGLRRVIRTRGVDVNAIGDTRVADPRGAFDVLLTLISGTTGVPKRILLGSEAGQLASSQDKGNWAERVEEERTNYAEPTIIKPLLAWLNTHGIFETPNLAQVKALWPEAYRMSPLERSQTSAQVARTLANIAKGLQPIELSPGTPAVVDPATGREITPATPGETSEPLLTRDEARRLIGLSTDQQMLIERPEN